MLLYSDYMRTPKYYQIVLEISLAEIIQYFDFNYR